MRKLATVNMAYIYQCRLGHKDRKPLVGARVQAVWSDVNIYGILISIISMSNIVR
jgi:hypothetical protein